MSSGTGSPPPHQTAPIEAMPTVYREPAQEPTENPVDVDFLRGIGGVLKIIEMVIIVIIYEHSI